MKKGNTSKSKCGLRNSDRIIWYNSVGAVVSRSDYSLWVYEKVDSWYAESFEVPTIDEGIRYLKGSDL